MASEELPGPFWVAQQGDRFDATRFLVRVGFGAHLEGLDVCADLKILAEVLVGEVILASGKVASCIEEVARQHVKIEF